MIYKVQFFILLFFSSTVFGQTAQNLFPDLQGKQLVRALKTAYKPTTVLSYHDAREVMYREIYNENGRVHCVYSDYSLRCSPHEANPIKKLQKFNFLKSIITEHSYPRSKGAREGPAKSDMHHLFPARLGVNVARRNYPFGEVEDRKTLKWFYKKESLKSPPKRNIALYAEKGDELFEPPEHFKGNIARAIFYFYTMYQEEALSADPTFFQSQIQTLLHWHAKDPVDQLEMQRTKQIAPYQSDKVNPFIIDPSLAQRAFGL